MYLVPVISRNSFKSNSGYSHIWVEFTKVNWEYLFRSPNKQFKKILLFFSTKETFMSISSFLIGKKGGEDAHPKLKQTNDNILSNKRSPFSIWLQAAI